MGEVTEEQERLKAFFTGECGIYDTLPAEWRALARDFGLHAVMEARNAGETSAAARLRLQAEIDANDPSRNGEWK